MAPQSDEGANLNPVTLPPLAIMVSTAIVVAISGCGGGRAGVVIPPDMPEIVGGTILPLLGVPSNHGLGAMERFTLQPGGSEEHGNVVISCPAGGSTCAVRVARDGTVQYESTGGIPSVMPALMSVSGVPSNHGLGAMERFTLRAGGSEEHGNVVISCPAGGSACVVRVAGDGTVQYESTGGIPSVMRIEDETGPEPPVPERPALADMPRIEAMALARAGQTSITDLDHQLHLGPDIAPDPALLDELNPTSSIRLYHGKVRDLSSARTLVEYMGSRLDASPDGRSFRTLAGPVTVTISDRADSDFRSYVVRAVQIVNAALPHRVRLAISEEPYVGARRIHPGTIGFFPATMNLAAGRANVLWNNENYVVGGTIQIDSAYVRSVLSESIESLGRERDTAVLALFVHELVHVLAIRGHPDQTRYTNSVMSYGSHPGYRPVMHPLDHDLLNAAYRFVRTGAYLSEMLSDLEPWKRKSVHLAGELETVNATVRFGARNANGFAQGWATGPAPYTELVENPRLSGSVTWDGRLAGMTPQAHAVTGDVTVTVNLGQLDGSAEFSGLEAWASGVAPGMPGSGTTWGDGNLNYGIEVVGNTFVQTGGDDGAVTGAFFGPQHEAMGGVLDRQDLAAGFGGTR